MRHFEFIKPEVEISEDKDDYGKFVIAPLERGYGLTLGNALRRVLLSSMPGVAIVAIELENVPHEFMGIKGIREDVTEIILNLKNIVFKIDDEALFKDANDSPMQLYALEIDVQGPKEVVAGDLKLVDGISVVNKEAHICSVAEGGKFKGLFFARRGIGYVSADENKLYCKDTYNGGYFVERIAIDSIYTPVTRCFFNVESMRVGEALDYEKLEINVYTNKGINPKDAVSLASQFLINHFGVLSDLNKIIAEKQYMHEQEAPVVDKTRSVKIEELDLSARSYNCLKRAGITTIGEIAERTEEDMQKIRNLGRKSLKEVEEKLKEHGLSFKKSTPFLPEKEDESATVDLSSVILDLDMPMDDDEDEE